MNIIPWNRRTSQLSLSTPFDELFQRLWSNGHAPTEWAERLPEVFQSRNFPAVNLAETETGFTVTMDCPGLDEKDFSVEIMGNNLVISGERKWHEEKKGKEFHRIESQYGKFERSVALPDNVRIDAGEVDATYKRGVLTVQLPKLERTPAAKIPVSMG